MTFRPASIGLFRLGVGSRIATATLTGLLALSGCGDDGGSSGDDIGATSMASETGMDETAEPPAGATFADVQMVLDEHCVTGCHEPGGTWQFFDLSSAASYESLTSGDPMQSDLPFVTAGDTEMSYVWHKINGTQSGVGGGAAMPLAREGETDPTVLTPAQFDTIEAWIMAGAPS